MSGWAIGRVRAGDGASPPPTPVADQPDHSQVGFLASDEASPTAQPIPIEPPLPAGVVGRTSALMGLAGQEGVLGLWYFGKKIDGT